MTWLLDINCLVALIWPSHADNATVSNWRKGKKLAVCPLTELGFLRVSCSPALGASMEDARKALQDFIRDESPAFLPADASALAGQPAPHWRKTTDWYLVNLAAAHGCKLATLDTGITHPAVDLISEHPAGQAAAG